LSFTRIRKVQPPSALFITLSLSIFRILTRKISEEDILSYINKTLETISKEKTIPENALFLILVITKTFLNVQFSIKKLIIKVFLKKNFLSYFSKDSNMIYLLVAFLSKVNEKTVYNMTIGNVLKAELESTDFSTNWPLQKVLSVILSSSVDKRLLADKTYNYNDKIENLLNLKDHCCSDRFKENLDYLLTYIFSNPDSLPSAEKVIKISSENQNLASIVGSLFEFISTSIVIRKRIFGLSP
jgi:hypothetical protein